MTLPCTDMPGVLFLKRQCVLLQQDNPKRNYFDNDVLCSC